MAFLSSMGNVVPSQLTRRQALHLSSGGRTVEKTIDSSQDPCWDDGRPRARPLIRPLSQAGGQAE